MYIKITEEHLRRCPDCDQSCLKIPEDYDAEFLDDEDETEVCLECFQVIVGGATAVRYRERLARSKVNARLDPGRRSPNRHTTAVVPGKGRSRP